MKIYRIINANIIDKAAITKKAAALNHWQPTVAKILYNLSYS